VELLATVSPPVKPIPLPPSNKKIIIIIIKKKEMKEDKLISFTLLN
jgi:hypothetical protein